LWRKLERTTEFYVRSYRLSIETWSVLEWRVRSILRELASKVGSLRMKSQDSVHKLWH